MRRPARFQSRARLNAPPTRPPLPSHRHPDDDRDDDDDDARFRELVQRLDDEERLRRTEIFLSLRGPGGLCLFNDPELIVMCGLHMEMRVGERLLQLLFMEAVQPAAGLTKAQVLDRWDRAEALIREHAVGWFKTTRKGLDDVAKMHVEGLTLPRQQCKKIIKLLFPYKKKKMRRGKVVRTTEIGGVLDILMPEVAEDHVNFARTVGVRAMMKAYVEMVRVISLATPRSKDPAADRVQFALDVESLRSATAIFGDEFYKHHGAGSLTN